jgi:UDP-GlcNAc:undecaprenyl-phosphate/decaprenyl-phosphate GlcNAc-1-phosphate transferase
MFFQQTYLFYFLLFLVPFIGTIILTPLIAKFAIIHRVLDQPGQNKVHLEPKPLLGGVAIFFCFALTVLIFLPLDEKLLSFVLATTVLLLTGLIDDIYNIKPIFKIIGQIIAASIVILSDISLYRFMFDYFSRFHIPDFIVLVLLIGWVVLIINAFNLIDGLDGLAAGTAAIILIAMAISLVITGGNPNIFGVQMVGLGACLGFLIYNFNPAKIFMGDTGSMLLGFALATMHLYTIKYPFSAQLVLGSMFIFAYPALDITYAFFRRIRNKNSVFKGDKNHIHHIILSLGFSMRKSVTIIYLANIIFAAMAVLLLSLEIPTLYILMIGIITAICVFILFIMLIKFSRQNWTGPNEIETEGKYINK